MSFAGLGAPPAGSGIRQPLDVTREPSCRSPGMRFIGGLPMNSATNTFAGWS